MVSFVLIALLVWLVVAALFIAYKALDQRTSIIRWGYADLWMVLPYALFVWAVIYVLAKGYRP